MDRLLLSVATLTLALAGCSDATGLADDDFLITPVETGLEITNRSGLDLFYQAIDVETLALWAGPTAVTMCADPDCPHVAPSQTLVVPWEDVLGWREDTTRIALYWWRVVADGQGGWRIAAEEVRSREVTVR